MKQSLKCKQGMQSIDIFFQLCTCFVDINSGPYFVNLILPRSAILHDLAKFFNFTSRQFNHSEHPEPLIIHGTSTGPFSNFLNLSSRHY